MTVFPLYLTIIQERPTSFPAPMGMTSRLSSSSSLRFIPFVSAAGVPCPCPCPCGCGCGCTPPEFILSALTPTTQPQWLCTQECAVLLQSRITWYNLEAEINVWNSLGKAAQANDIDTVTKVVVDSVLCNTSTRLHQHMWVKGLEFLCHHLQ